MPQYQLGQPCYARNQPGRRLRRAMLASRCKNMMCAYRPTAPSARTIICSPCAVEFAIRDRLGTCCRTVFSSPQQFPIQISILPGKAHSQTSNATTILMQTGACGEGELDWM